MFKTGIRGKNNQMILFSRVEPMPGTRWIHADAESMPNERGSDRVSEPSPGPALSALFEPGAHKRAAVKIVDNRGIESLKVIPLP